MYRSEIGRQILKSIANASGPQVSPAQVRPPKKTGDRFAQRELNRVRRRVDHIIKSGLFTEPDQPIVIKEAKSLEELHEAYRLVHDVFVSQGYIKPQPNGMRIRVFEIDPRTATFVAKVNQSVVGVMSIVVDSVKSGLPSDKVYKPEIDQLRHQGRKLCESSNLAVAPGQRNTAVFMELSRCCTAHAANIGMDDIIVAISPGHAMFFETLLGFMTWGECRNYSEETVDPVELKRLDLSDFRSYLQFVDLALGNQAFLHDWFFVNNHHLTCYSDSTEQVEAEVPREFN